MVEVATRPASQCEVVNREVSVYMIYVSQNLSLSECVPGGRICVSVSVLVIVYVYVAVVVSTHVHH